MITFGILAVLAVGFISFCKRPRENGGLIICNKKYSPLRGRGMLSLLSPGSILKISCLFVSTQKGNKMLSRMIIPF